MHTPSSSFSVSLGHEATVGNTIVVQVLWCRNRPLQLSPAVTDIVFVVKARPRRCCRPRRQRVCLPLEPRQLASIRIAILSAGSLDSRLSRQRACRYGHLQCRPYVCRPILLAVYTVGMAHRTTLLLALIWIAHIGVDRMLGFGSIRLVSKTRISILSVTRLDEMASARSDHCCGPRCWIHALSVSFLSGPLASRSARPAGD
jgi:hypothetical protein